MNYILLVFFYIFSVISICQGFYPARLGIDRREGIAVTNDIRHSTLTDIVSVQGPSRALWTNLMAKPAGGGKRRGGSGGGPSKKVKDDVIQVDGRVTESLPNAMFRVEIEPSGNSILATISGKIRKNFVRIVVGDKVVVELSAYDLTKGRITYRTK